MNRYVFKPSSDSQVNFKINKSKCFVACSNFVNWAKFHISYFGENLWVNAIKIDAKCGINHCITHTLYMYSSLIMLSMQFVSTKSKKKINSVNKLCHFMRIFCHKGQKYDLFFLLFQIQLQSQIDLLVNCQLTFGFSHGWFLR